MQKNTKIVCTLGPSSDSVSEITKLIQAGMNVARLNFSHGTYEHHKKIINNLHKAEKATNKTIGIIQDLQGPKIRIANLENQLTLKKGQKITFSSKEDSNIFINYKDLTKDVKKGHRIFINDGLIETEVIQTSPKNHIVTAKVIYGGEIKNGNGVNFPDSNISIPTITEKDKKDLKFGLKNNVDFIALSFVKDANDIKQLRKIIKGQKIIAKIERHEAVKNLKEIIKEADGIMVARGDLGTNIPPEQVPIIQKLIIKLANKYSKPVITATQVLQSMVTESRATRAEISDAANAIFDHTDAIMLSNETAVGKYPFKATKTLTNVAIATETELQKHNELIEYVKNSHQTTALNAACQNACELALSTKANAIILYTEDGYTPAHIARHRLYIPTITITPKQSTKRQLTLSWGINNILVKKFSNNNSKKVQEITDYLKKEKIVKKGQKIVILCNASQKESIISSIKI
ncbi:pyruvate kinase [Candidatus Peregrinibacteria bacterium CG10_big_fil_rev_8_21_14_0_10_36_19]|nr:MAG: pyruvate kinase [Candidatus Peregrinibacteria bacterium CG10_big_fil_rev_8_21_14_0_10_36_19]